MKSLLVDALRAANDNDDGLEIEETPAPEVAVTLPATLEAAVPDMDADLELLENLSETTELEAANSDARFPDETSVEEQPLLAKTLVLAHSRAAMFERAAIWMPVVCLLLAAVSAASFSGWSNVTGMGQNTDLDALSGQANMGTGQVESAVSEQASRFEFIDVAHVPTVKASRSAPVSVNTQRTKPSPSDIVISRSMQAPRSIAGMTDVDDASFSSVGAVYQAFASGRITTASLERLLARRVATGGESVELEIKLLLQRYPDSAPLHNALGSLYANSARWPEARVAFDRAGELTGSASGSALQ